MGEFLLGVDQGTTGSTAIVFDRSARVAGKAYREFRQSYPKPGWVEHDPDEIWSATLGAAREAISTAGITADRIEGLGLTNQRETTVIWDRTTACRSIPLWSGSAAGPPPPAKD